jgi:predicted dehydrogenase
MPGKTRIGVFGAARGAWLGANAEAVGMKVVAVCDTWEARRDDAARRFAAEAYADFDRFLEHDMDAVILANFYHQHAPYAIRALDAGLHVLSECIACKTLAEGAALARAVERSGRIYMFAENYAYICYVQEMRRLYRAGEIGEVQYAEGEYNHPADSRTMNALAQGMNHWRNHTPPTYYPTHAMSPIMYVTDTRPTSVNALSIPYSDMDKERLTVRRGDPGAVMICRMDNGSVARLMGLTLRGHSIYHRFHGTRGMMENLRAGDMSMLRVIHEEWDRRAGDVAEKIYQPDFPHHSRKARQSGHGGGDYFVLHHFAEAIRKNAQPYLDVYKALDMTFVGIQGWRSCLADGAPFEIPDFRNQSVRKAYENDRFSPFPEDRAPGQPWPSIKGELKPSEDAVAFARSVWAEMGYHGE